MNVRAYAYVNSGRFEQAAEWANRALRQPNAPRNPYFVLVIALSHLGRAEVLREAADALFKISPGVSISNIRDSIPFKRKEDIELWVDGLRKAGVPE